MRATDTGAEAFMTREQWRTRTSWNDVCARAVGRKRYNQERRKWANERADEVFKLLLAHGWNTWGVITRIAHELQVHKSTIARDRQRIERSMLGH
jgi:hypothetical protein